VRIFILSVWIWAAALTIILTVTVTSVLGWLAGRPLGRHARWANVFMRWGGRAITRCHPFWHQTITGALPEDAHRGYVLVGNHESHADSLFICHLPVPMVWLVKAELLRIPFLGWNLAMAGCVPVVRGDRESGDQAMAVLKAKLDRGFCVFVFPEGTRSASGEVGPFKTGAFRLAVSSGRPIVPVVLTGCGQALPKGGWRLGAAETAAQMHLLPPEPVTGLTLEDVEPLRDRVRAKIVAAREQLRAGVGASP
jgi:1-acyl-sn-glycerol-3-phosphate acyltransferase